LVLASVFRPLLPSSKFSQKQYLGLLVVIPLFTSSCLRSNPCDSADAGCNASAALLLLSNLTPPSGNLPVSGVFFWLKANAGVIRSGSQATGWEDQSGNGNHVYGHATYIPGVLAGNPVMRFSGPALNEMQPNNSIQFFSTANQGLTAFTVFRTVEDTNQRFIFTLYLNNCVTNVELGYGLDNVAGNFGIHAGCSHGDAAASVIQNGTYTAMTFRALASGTAGANVNVFQNGRALASAQLANAHWVDAGSYDTAQGILTIGARGAPGPVFDDFHEGDIAEIIVYRSDLSDADRILIECYLTHKYGLSNSAGCT